MKPRDMKLALTAALIAGGGLFAQAAEPEEEELAFGEATLWLGPDEIVETFGTHALWLGPDEIVEAFDELSFALGTLFPDLPPNPTEDDIIAAINASGAIDKNRILALILGAPDPVAAYRAFQAWAAGIGDVSVAESAHAGDSFAFGVESLFEEDPKVEFTAATVGSNGSGSTEMTVAVTVKDGATAKPVSAAKVAEMFEATSDLADWDDKKLDPNVTVRTQDTVATPVEFTISPGDGKAPKAFLRIRK